MERDSQAATLPYPPLVAEAVVGQGSDFPKMVMFVESVRPEVCEPRYRQRPTGKVARGKCWINEHGRLVRR